MTVSIPDVLDAVHALNLGWNQIASRLGIDPYDLLRDGATALPETSLAEAERLVEEAKQALAPNAGQNGAETPDKPQTANGVADEGTEEEPSVSGPEEIDDDLVKSEEPDEESVTAGPQATPSTGHDDHQAKVDGEVAGGGGAKAEPPPIPTAALQAAAKALGLSSRTVAEELGCGLKLLQAAYGGTYWPDGVPLPYRRKAQDIINRAAAKAAKKVDSSPFDGGATTAAPEDWTAATATAAGVNPYRGMSYGELMTAVEALGTAVADPDAGTQEGYKQTARNALEAAVDLKFQDVDLHAFISTLISKTGFGRATLNSLHKRLKRERKPSAADAAADKARAEAEAEAAARWPETVDGAELFEAIFDTIGKYVVLGEAERIVCAIWVIHTWLLEVFHHSPRLQITSAVPECGKSILAAVLGRLSRRPLRTESITPSALFRVIAQRGPTLLLDEFDNLPVEEQSEYRSILNAGFEKGGVVIKSVKIGEDFVATDFPVFGAIVYSGIGGTNRPLESRSITIRMQKKLKTEKVVRYRPHKAADLGELARKISRFAADNAKALHGVEPAMSDDFFNRGADVWEPLLAIADLGGPEWGDKLREAARDVMGKVKIPKGSETLIGDIKMIRDESFRLAREDGKPVPKTVTSLNLAGALSGMEHRSWGEYGKPPKPITRNQLSRLLSAYELTSGTVRDHDGSVEWGFYWTDFNDVFERYP